MGSNNRSREEPSKTLLATGNRVKGGQAGTGRGKVTRGLVEIVGSSVEHMDQGMRQQRGRARRRQTRRIN